MSFATLRKTVCTDIDIGTALKEIAANPHIGDALAFDVLDGRHIECVVTDIDDNAIRFDSMDCLGDSMTYNKVEKWLDRIDHLLPEEVRQAIVDTERKHIIDGKKISRLERLFLPAAPELGLPRGARIWRVVPGRTPTVYATGLTNVTDLAWSGVTLWRAVVATVVEGFDRAPVGIRVTGHATHPSSFLVAAWLQRRTGVPTIHEPDPEARTITGVHFSFEDGSEVSLTRRAVSQVAHLVRTGLDTTYVNLPRRSVQDCLMEELRRLDPDVFYSEVLTRDLPRLPAAVALLEGDEGGGEGRA